MDLRKKKILTGLRQLSRDGIQRIYDALPGSMVLDGVNFDPETGKW